VPSAQMPTSYRQAYMLVFLGSRTCFQKVSFGFIGYSSIPPRVLPVSWLWT